MVYTSEHPIFAVTVDIVLLAGSPAQVLMVRRGGDPYAGRLAFPGGFVDPDEDLLSAARRELAEECGLRADEHGLDLRQLAAYGAPDRDPRQRTVSVAHLARLDEPLEVTAGDDADEADWYDAESLLEDPDSLAFDHAQILRDALAR